ncbi:MAG: DUF305 domain-containing protein [Candidatus Curtissbacteria bacterium]
MTEEKSTSRESILFGVIGLLLGIVIAVLFARNAVNNDMQSMMRMMGMRTSAMNEERSEMMEDMMGHENSSMTMDQMSQSLRGKTGDEFDRAFIDSMIEHHQGAIDMANLAKVNAKHQEIKDLADDIINAQTNEIETMREWQKIWGY